MRLKSETGDTIIEVMLAITVFSIVAIGALTVMNRGVQTAQKSLEITLVRQQIDAQAEALRYVHANMSGSSKDVWTAINSVGSVAPLEVQNGECPPLSTRAFILNARNAKVIDQVNLKQFYDKDIASKDAPYPHVTYSDVSEVVGVTGISIESARQASDKYVDFHIKACWYAPGDTVPTTLGSIVRFYAP